VIRQAPGLFQAIDPQLFQMLARPTRDRDALILEELFTQHFGDAREPQDLRLRFWNSLHLSSSATVEDSTIHARIIALR
jgi:hypothetical protein